MVVAIVRTITVNSGSITFSFETDLTDPNSGTPLFLTVSVSRQALVTWLEDHPGGTQLEYLREQVTAQYVQYERMIALGIAAEPLIGQDIFA